MVFCGCKKEKTDPKLSVLEMKEMSDLATVEYTITKVIKASDNKTWYKIGDRKILMSCEAFIKAGIDLSAITQQDITINDKSISIHLPQPKIISLHIQPEKIVVEYEETSGFRTNFSAANRDELVKQAEGEITNSINSLGIIEQSKVNTTAFIRNYLVQLGFENINLNFDKSNFDFKR
jgi:hypothetical protein